MLSELREWYEALSRRETYMLQLAGICIIVVGYYVAVFSPMSDKRDLTEARVNAYASQLKEMRELHRQVASLPSAPVRFSPIDTRLRGTFNANGIYDLALDVSGKVAVVKADSVSFERLMKAIAQAHKEGLIVSSIRIVKGKHAGTVRATIEFSGN